MHKLLLSLILLCSGFAHETYGEIDSSSSRMTFLTNTSPVRSHPSTALLEKSLKSFEKIQGFEEMPKIIVFDAPRPKFHPDGSPSYEEYKERCKQLLNTQPGFKNTLLVFMDEWGHLAQSQKTAWDYIETDYVFVHQHDMELLRPFDLENLLISMDNNPEIKYVRLSLASQLVAYGNSEVFVQQYEGPTLVPLCISYNWSDHEHVVHREYYPEFVFPRMRDRAIAPETSIAKPLRAHLLANPQAHPSYGLYCYGEYGGKPYIHHLNGHKWHPKN